MRSPNQSLYREIRRFTKDSEDGFIQLLVATAKHTTFKRIISCPTYPVALKTPGLSDAVAALRSALDNDIENIPNVFGRVYASLRSIKERKRAGQFFTSKVVAEQALQCVRPAVDDDICDAGAGTLVFANAITHMGIQVRSYVGVENDPILALCGAHVLEGLNAPAHFRVWYTNFLLLSKSMFQNAGLAVPTLIISNPPFVRYHNLSGRAEIRSSLKSSLGIELSPFSGSMAYFLARAAELAGHSDFSRPRSLQNRRLLFLLPKEASGAAHVQKLLHDLRRSYGWICQEHQIAHSEGDTAAKSGAVALFFALEQKRSRGNPAIVQTTGEFRIRDLLQIRRGISTGCNDFFVLTDPEALSADMDKKKWLKKVLPTRIHLPHEMFSVEDWERLREEGHPCWLMALPNVEPEELDGAVRRYLRRGLRRGLHLTPTAQGLRTWFSLPIPPTPPDLFVTYFFRGAPRFILNDAGVFNLTNILSARFTTPDIERAAKEKLVKLLNEQSQSWMNGRMAGREYKGGLRKIEPREFSLLPISSAIMNVVNRQPQILRATPSLF